MSNIPDPDVAGAASLPALITRPAQQVAGAATAAEVLDDRDAASLGQVPASEVRP
ncbi:hypothetical protein [Luteitalea sp.]